MYNSLDSVEEEVLKLIETHHFSEALKAIQSFVEMIVKMEEMSCVIFSNPLLDDLCQRIGAQVFQENQIILSPPNDNLVVYIATELYLYGGHTAVIEDLIHCQPNKKHIILLTRESTLENVKALENRFSSLPVELVYSKECSLIDKVIWIQSFLKLNQPSKTFLLNHNQDSVAVAAVQPGIVPELIYYHHGDHNLCLGVHLTHALHIDPHPMGFYNCKDQLHIKNNIYLPLIVMEQTARSKNISFCKNNQIKTCSSGRPYKFLSPYQYSYVQILPQIMQATRGLHVHIGPLPESSLNEIYQGLDFAKIPRDRFIYIPWVKSIWEALIDHKIDLYITSFPFGGGKVCIEAMGAGIPIVIHSSYRSQFHGGECMAYPEAFRWKKPKELIQFLSTLTPEFLEKQSYFARSHYEKFHRPEILMKELKTLKGIPPPIIPKHEPDLFQIAFENKALSQIDFEKKMQETLNIVYQSNSWRITKPLRDLKDFLYKLKNFIAR